MTDAAVARHYFDDLATQNDAVSSCFDGPVPTGQDVRSVSSDCNPLQGHMSLRLASDGGCGEPQMVLPVRVCHMRRT